jgi:hypothetical protein
MADKCFTRCLFGKAPRLDVHITGWRRSEICLLSIEQCPGKHQNINDNVKMAYEYQQVHENSIMLLSR